jgi:hypothetical protein
MLEQVRLGLKNSTDKYSSLFGRIISDEEEKSYNIDTSDLYYKVFLRP